MPNFRCLIFGVIVLLFFSGTEAFGADWKFLDGNKQGEFFYDKEGITRSSKDIFGVWLRVVYSEQFIEKEGLEKSSETVGLWEINCRDKQVSLLSTSHYFEKGEMSPPQIWIPPEWKFIGPDTIMDALYKELCENEVCIFEPNQE